MPTIPVDPSAPYQSPRLEQLRYWQGKTVQERLAGSYAITRQVLILRGYDPDIAATDFTPSFARHSRTAEDRAKHRDDAEALTTTDLL